jgi:hypothetical protein
MFKDTIQWSYIDLDGYKNVVAQFDKAREASISDRTFGVRPILLELFDKLMRERPTWRFKGDLPQGGIGKHTYVSQFEVFDGDAKLGYVKYGYSARGEDCIKFDNHRLQATRERGGDNYSTKVDAAAKRILKMFHTKTRKERGGEAFNTAKKVISDLQHERVFAFRRKFQPVQDHLTAYLMDNWITASEYLKTKGVSTDGTTPELYHAQIAAVEVVRAVSGGVGVTVRSEGSDYLVTREYANTRDVEVFANDTLSDHLKAGLGILKLIEPKSIIQGVGVRVDANTFFILDPEKT